MQDQYTVSEENDQLDRVTQTLSMICLCCIFFKAYAYKYIYSLGTLLAEAQEDPWLPRGKETEKWEGQDMVCIQVCMCVSVYKHVEKHMYRHICVG